MRTARQIGVPEAGFYRVRLVKGGIHVPVRIWFGAPVVDGEELDRSPRWCAEVDGETTRVGPDGVPELLDVHEVWPFVERITAEEFSFMVRRREWARSHGVNHPAATPREKINLRELPPSW